jgi:hypothetical protein
MFSQQFTIRTSNIALDGTSKKITFDVYIKNTSGLQQQLSGIQLAFNVNKAALGTGATSATIIAPQGPLFNYTAADSGLDYTTGDGGGHNIRPNTPGTITAAGAVSTIQLAAHTPPGAHNGYWMADQNEVLVGHIQLTNSVVFVGGQSLGLVFRTFAVADPVTKITCYTQNPAIGPQLPPLTPDPIGSYNINTEVQNQAAYVNATDYVILPVELTSFTATAKSRDMELKWSTATEVNSQAFEVQRTISGKNDWKAITSVNAAGNSNSKKDYSFVDKKLNSGKYSYRLRTINTDGTSELSNVIEGMIDLPTEFALSQNYPNPFNPETKVDYQLPQDSHVSIELFSMNGERVAQLLNEQQTAGYYTMTVSSNIARGLASGVYLYRVNATGVTGAKFNSVKKMILMK